MEINLDERRLVDDEVTWEMIRFFQENEQTLGLDQAQLYYDFPILKDADDRVVVAKILLISPRHGVVAMTSLGVASAVEAKQGLEHADADLENVFSLIYSRLIRNKQLRRSRTELLVPTHAIIFAPNLGTMPEGIELVSSVALNTSQLGPEHERRSQT